MDFVCSTIAIFVCLSITIFQSTRLVQLLASPFHMHTVLIKSNETYSHP